MPNNDDDDDDEKNLLDQRSTILCSQKVFPPYFLLSLKMIFNVFLTYYTANKIKLLPDGNHPNDWP